MIALSVPKLEDGIVNEDAVRATQKWISVSDGAGGGGVNVAERLDTRHSLRQHTLRQILVERAGDRHANGAVKTVEDRQLNQHRQTAARRTLPLAFIEFLDFFVVPLLVVAVPFLQFLHFRLKPLHACHALLLIDGQRKHEQSGENGKRNDRYTEISENVVEKHQHIAENFADKVKKCIHFLINFPLLLNFQIENLSVPLRNISKRD